MKLHADQRGTARSVETIAIATLMAVVGVGLKAPLERAIGDGVPERVSQSLTFGTDGGAEPTTDASAPAVAGDVILEPYEAAPADGGPVGVVVEGADVGVSAAPAGALGAQGPAPEQPDVGEQILATLPTGALGRALGLAAVGDTSIDDALLGLVPTVSGGLISYALDEAGVPSPLDAAAATALTGVVQGALLGGLDAEALAEATVGSLAREGIQDLLSDVPVPGVGSAVGSLVSGLIQGADISDLAVDAGVKIGTSNLLALAGGAAPVLGPLAGVITSALTGKAVPGPGSLFGSTLGAIFGGPLGALGGGLIGGLIDGLLGWGEPSDFTVTEELDVSGDGKPDEIAGLLDDGKGYRYSVALNDLLAQQHPFRQASYELRAYDAVSHEGILKDVEGCGGTCARDGRPGTYYFLENHYEFEPLFPTTQTAGFGEGLPVWRSDGETSYDVLEGGTQVTAEEYAALTQALGGTSGAIAADDPRFALLAQHMPRYGDDHVLGFDQADRGGGIYFRQDLNDDGIPEILRNFPQIDDFVNGDGRTELVGLGIPGSG